MSQSVIDTTENCRHCLMCRHMCPVGHVTNLESLTPHGWGQVVASEKRGLIEWNADTSNVMYSCADCGVCESHCVTDQPLPDAIAAVRANLVEAGITPPGVEEMKARLTNSHNAFVDQAPEAASGKGDVALFVGDAGQHLQPDAVTAAVKLLKAASVQPVLVGKGRNNGFLAASLGLTDLAKELVQATLDEVKKAGAKKLVVLAPGDAYAFGSMLSARLDMAMPDGVEVVEAVSLLADALDSGSLSFKPPAMGIPFAYVDPTHTVRALDRCDAPRRLLAAVLPTPPIELFWRKERAHPAGDGALAFLRPDISALLAEARLDDARERGAQTVVTECPATLDQLTKHGNGMPAKGLYELLAEYVA